MRLLKLPLKLLALPLMLALYTLHIFAVLRNQKPFELRQPWNHSKQLGLPFVA